MTYENWTVHIEYTAGVWTDVTSRVDTARGPVTITSGDTPEASADTGGVTLPLLNHDQAFTPGNALSALALRPGLRVRIRETVSDQVFDRLTGYTEYPEIEAWTESNATAPRDQVIMVPVIDRVAWLAKGRKFVSTLAEHIIYHGGPSLVGYWPMGESSGPDVNPVVGAPWTLTQTRRVDSYDNDPNAGEGAIRFGAAGIPPADDITSIEFTPSTSTSPTNRYVTSLMLTGQRPTPVTLSAGQVLTVIGWTKPGELLAGASAGPVIQLTSVDTIAWVEVFIDSSGNLVGRANNVDWVGTITGPPAPRNHAMPVAVRVGFSPPVLELWVRGEVYPGTLTVFAATSKTFNTLNVAEQYPGTVNHAQVYLGNATDWTHDDFVAQYELGLYGMERQTAGERVRTVLQYAGVDPSELGRIDGGSSLMQAASLAGRGPIDLVTDAVTTEQGEFYADGSGLPVFAGRKRLYNI